MSVLLEEEVDWILNLKNPIKIGIGTCVYSLRVFKIKSKFVADMTLGLVNAHHLY